MATTAKTNNAKKPRKSRVTKARKISVVSTTPEAQSNAALQARRQAAVPRGVASAASVFAERAENAELWDVEGNRYVDFAGGIAVLNTGHRHPAVIAAAKAQEDKYTHTSFQVVPYEPYIALAEKLNTLAPGAFDKKSLLVTTGAEAVENAVKIARAATGRPGVIAFTGGYHGRTLLTLGMTGKISPYKKDVGPFPSDIFRAPFPSVRDGISVEDALKGLQNLFLTDAQPDRIAAIIIEPVLGEGGYTPVPFDMLRALRDICDEHGILLIADEIQAGFGRTGRCLRSNTLALCLILSRSQNQWRVGIRSRVLLVALTSWTPWHRVDWVAHMAATPLRARLHWRPSKRWNPKGFWNVHWNWEHISARVSPRLARGPHHSGCGTFAALGPCWRSSLSPILKLRHRMLHWSKRSVHMR